jgi:hypothetical protein
MIPKDSVFYSNESVQEILERCGLYNQAFDYRLGLYNENNKLLDTKIDYDQSELIKVRMYPTFDKIPYCLSTATLSFYLPFHIRLCDRTIYLEIDPENDSY